ncbi:hypothetical protein ACHWQZ_G000370 [Mnemiopsis leidyi]
MGVKGLWRVLQQVREEVPITSLRGKVLAVDLAIWVVQSETVTNNELQGIYLRQMFYKINHLLEHGVGIIIVTDGRAPHLKALTIARRLGVELDRNNKVIQRRRFMKIMKECEILAQSLGITVLKGAFEAEAAAAKLQQDGIVDGVITTDGDAFLYGARQVYRNLLVTEKFCEVYKMSRVETEVGLSRDDLVGMAILNGCDFNPDGVSGLGRGTVLNYIQSRDRTRTVTEELVDWSRQAGQIGEKYKQLEGIKRKPHCSICKHQGSKKEHTQSGCTCCNTTSGCAPGNGPCECTKHVAQRLLNSPHMQCCVKFVKQNNVAIIPVQEIVNEFRNNRANDPVSPGWELPPCFTFINFMAEKLQWRKQVSAEKFCHVAALHHISQNLNFSKPYPLALNTCLEFNHILKKRRRDKVEMLELEYSVVDDKLKAWLEFDVAYAVMDAQIVEHLLPDEVREFYLRDKQLARKKKENIPIYDRYPVKKPTPEKEKSKQVTRPKTAGTKNRKGKKIDILSESMNGLKISEPLPLRDITGSISSISSTPLTQSCESEIVSNKKLSRASEKNSRKHNDTSSSEEEYVPLSQRLAQRRAKSAKSAKSVKSANSAKSTSSPDTAVGSTSSLSSLDSKQTSLNSDIGLRRQQTETETDNAVLETESVGQLHEDNTLSGSEMDGYIDSDVQLLPQNFMDEYLDLSRDEILGISRDEVIVSRDESPYHVICGEEDGEEWFDEDSVIVVDEKDKTARVENEEICGEISDSQQQKGKSLEVDEIISSRDDKSISRENSSLLNTESVDSEDYKPLVEGADYHKLFFPTPAVEKGAGTRDTVDGREDERGVSGPRHLDIPTMNLSTSFSDISTSEDHDKATSIGDHKNPTDVIDISSEADWDTTAEISANTENEVFYCNDVVRKIELDHEETQQDHNMVKGLSSGDVGFNHEKSAIALENSGVNPENSGPTPENSGVPSENSGVTLENCDIPPGNSDIAFENSGVSPENSAVALKNSDFSLENSGVASENSVVTSGNNGNSMKNSGVKILETNQVNPDGSQENTSKHCGLNKNESNSKKTLEKTSPKGKVPDGELSLDLSCDLDSELANISDISRGFSPKTPAPKQRFPSDMSNLSLSEHPGGFTPDEANLSLDLTQTSPLPDISSELAGSVIRESVEELSCNMSDNLLKLENSDIPEGQGEAPDLRQIYADEIVFGNKILSEQSVSLSPAKSDCTVLVPDTPATTREPPQDTATSPDVTSDVTHHVTPDVTHHVTLGTTSNTSDKVTTLVDQLEESQEVALSGELSPLQPITTKPSLPIQQKLSFDPPNISELELTSTFSAPDKDVFTLPSPGTFTPDIPSRMSPSSPDPFVRGILSPDPIIPGIISKPHRPPDISFLEPQIEVSTPVWHRKPLSDIRVTSTPKQFPESGEGGGFVGSDPLPDIVSERGRLEQPNFNLNITELLGRSGNLA